MWIKIFIFLEIDDEIEYYYKFEMKKLYVIFFSKIDEVLDL